jgi:hypothetical protein
MANTEKMEWDEERGLFVGILPDGGEITVTRETWEAVEQDESLDAYPGDHPTDWQYMKSSGWKGISGGW